jgi:metallo-beta-lactamase class B
VNEGGKKFLAAIIGGWSSNPGVTYVSIKGKPASYPGIEKDFERTFATYKALPVDIFLGAHGVYFNMLQKLDQGARTNPALWIDREGYKAAIQKADENFHRELAKEQAAAK